MASKPFGNYFKELKEWNDDKARKIPKGQVKNCTFIIYPFDLENTKDRSC